MSNADLRVMPLIWLQLTVDGVSLDSELLDKAVGFCDDGYWKRQELRTVERGSKERWEIRGPKHRSWSLEEMLDRDLSEIRERGLLLGPICCENGWDAVLGYCVQIVEHTPSFHFDQSVLKHLAASRLKLDIDLYVVEPETIQVTLAR